MCCLVRVPGRCEIRKRERVESEWNQFSAEYREKLMYRVVELYRELRLWLNTKDNLSTDTRALAFSLVHIYA